MVRFRRLGKGRRGSGESSGELSGGEAEASAPAVSGAASETGEPSTGYSEEPEEVADGDDGSAEGAGEAEGAEEDPGRAPAGSPAAGSAEADPAEHGVATSWYTAVRAARSWRWRAAQAAAVAVGVAGVSVLSVFIYSVFDDGRDRDDGDRREQGWGDEQGWYAYEGSKHVDLGDLDGKDADAAGAKSRYDSPAGGHRGPMDSGAADGWRGKPGLRDGGDARKWADSGAAEGRFGAVPRRGFDGEGCTVRTGPRGGWIELCYRRGPGSAGPPFGGFDRRGDWAAPLVPEGGRFFPDGRGGPEAGEWFGWAEPGTGWCAESRSPWGEGSTGACFACGSDCEFDALRPFGWDWGSGPGRFGYAPFAEGGPLPSAPWLEFGFDGDDDHAVPSPYDPYGPFGGDGPGPFGGALEGFSLGGPGLGGWEVLLMWILDLFSDPEVLPELLDDLAELLESDGSLGGFFGFEEGDTDLGLFDPDGLLQDLFGPDGPLGGLLDEIDPGELFGEEGEAETLPRSRTAA